MRPFVHHKPDLMLAIRVTVLVVSPLLRDTIARKFTN